jgi:hypothetical protein
VTAHAERFRLSWRKSGIWLTHVGLILLLIGEGLSGLLQRDGQVRLDVGQTKRYVESFRENELAVADVTNPGFDDVVAIPVARLAGQDVVQHPKLPFTLKPLAFFPNAILRSRSQVANPPPAIATMGDGTDVIAEPAPVTYKPDESNFPTGYVELAGPEGPLGTWLVSAMLDQPQTFTYQGRTWQLALRARRDYLPFTLTLGKFTHDIYPGTDIPKNFASTIQLRSDDGRDDRSVLISMNNPLRYGGLRLLPGGLCQQRPHLGPGGRAQPELADSLRLVRVDNPRPRAAVRDRPLRVLPQARLRPRGGAGAPRPLVAVRKHLPLIVLALGLALGGLDPGAQGELRALRPRGLRPPARVWRAGG